MEFKDSITHQIKITSKEDVFKSQIEWGDVYKLLPASPELRFEICRHLIRRCRKFGVEPLPLWRDIINHPEFYDQWNKRLQEGEEE